MSRMPKNWMAQLLVLSIAFVSGIGIAAAEIYKYVDAEGNVSYSSEPPPPGGKAENVTLGPEPTAQQIREAEEQQRAMQHETVKYQEINAEAAAAAAAQQDQQVQQSAPPSGSYDGPPPGVVAPIPPGVAYPIRPGYDRPVNPEQRPVEREDERGLERGRRR